MRPHRRALFRRGLLWRENLDGWLMVLPWVLGFLFWTLGPMLASAVLGMIQWDVLTPPKWAGLANSLTLSRDPIFAVSLYNMAASAIQILPVIILFFAAQEYFVQGIQLTGLSGR